MAITSDCYYYLFYMYHEIVWVMVNIIDIKTLYLRHICEASIITRDKSLILFLSIYIFYASYDIY